MGLKLVFIGCKTSIYGYKKLSNLGQSGNWIACGKVKTAPLEGAVLLFSTDFFTNSQIESEDRARP